MLGPDTVKNLVGHPFEGLILDLFSVTVEDGVSLLAWVDTSVEESLEVLLEGLLPEEFLVLILVDELVGGSLNITEVMRDDLNCSEKLKLILDFDQVVTSVGV